MWVWRAAPGVSHGEAFAALGRLCRAGRLGDADVAERLALLEDMPVRREPLPPLPAGAWARRAELRLVDALYAEPAARLRAPLITTDGCLGRAIRLAEVIGG